MLSRIARSIAPTVYHELMARGFFRNIWYPRYQFQYFPRQLCFLANCLEHTRVADGAVVEIGCAHGLTTTFLYEYMADSEISKDYICIDTFSGFTDDDISVEVDHRGKNHDYRHEFKNNRAEWFKESLARRHITDINVIASDICTLDEKLLPPQVAFCLLDVDLYRPVKLALEKIFPRLSVGGMIVVDDCWSKPKHMWVDGVGDAYDGAMQAYREFTGEHGLPLNLVETKLGVIERRPSL